MCKNTDSSISKEELNMCEQRNEMLKMLIASDLGISIGECYKGEDIEPSDDILIACVDRAYRDVCRTMQYKDDVPDESKQEFKRSFFKLIRKKIKDKEAKDDWYKIEKIRDSIKNEDLFEREFTIGITQKWVNMTFKYLWLLGFKCEKQNAGVPIDRYILGNEGKTVSVSGLNKDVYDGIQDKYKTVDAYKNENNI